MAARPDGHALAVRLLRDQPAAAARRLRGGAAAQSGDVAGRGRRPGRRVLRAERAHPGAGRRRGGVRAQRPIRAGSSRARSTRSSGRWARASCRASGTIPMSTLANQPPGKYAVKFNIAERDRELFLAAGAVGDAAIYTQHARDPAHRPQGDPARGFVHELPRS